MKVKTVTYSQLFSFGRFQNETIGYTAELAEHENPDMVLKGLMSKAILQHHENQKNRDQGHDIQLIETVEQQCSNELKVIQDTYQELRSRLQEQGYELLQLAHLEENISYAEERLKNLIEEKEQALRRLTK